MLAVIVLCFQFYLAAYMAVHAESAFSLFFRQAPMGGVVADRVLQSFEPTDC